MLPAILVLLTGIIGSFFILRSGQPKVITTSPIVHYEDYVIDHDGTLVFTHKHIDTKV